MQILQHQQQRSGSAQPAEQAAQPIKQPPPAQLRCPRPLPGRAVPGQLGQHPRQLGPELPEDGRLVIIGQDPQRLHQRRVRHRPASQRRGTAHRDQRPRPPGLLGELPGQPGLAHPGLAGDQQHRRRPAAERRSAACSSDSSLSRPTNSRAAAGRAPASAAPITAPPAGHVDGSGLPQGRAPSRSVPGCFQPPLRRRPGTTKHLRPRFRRS